MNRSFLDRAAANPLTRMWSRVLAIGMVVFVAGTTPAGQEAQSVPPSPHPVDTLVGEWRGEGRVLGGEGRLTLRFARVLNDRFLELTYLAQPAQGAAFEGRALYTIEGRCAGQGWWFDGNGATYPIESRCTDGGLETRWGNERIKGSSRYHVRDGQLHTTDFIAGASGEQRELTRVTLARVPAPAP